MHERNKRLAAFTQSIARPQIILAALLGFVAVAVLVNAVWGQSFSYLMQTFGYTADQAYQTLQEIGPEGRLAHLRVLIPDVVMVLLYETVLIGAGYAITTKLTNNCLTISIFTFAPLLLGAIQLVEVVALAVVLFRYPVPMLSLLQVTSVITMLKTILTVLFFALPLIGLLVLAIKKIAGRARA